jgi:hypothetical protein
MSKNKYTNKIENTQKFGELFANIGNEIYIVVKEDTKSLNEGFPYLLY